MSFILNIVTPPIFILSYLITFTYLFHKFFKKKPVLEEFLISFIFINAIIFILICLKIKVYLLIQVFFLIIALISIFVLMGSNIKLFSLNQNNLKIFNTKFYNYFFYLIFFTYLIISLYPINDADSYAYHLSWPKSVIENPNILFDLSFLEYRVVGIGEILNYISLSIYSENLQSFLALILFTILIIKFLKNKPILFFLSFSSPLLIKYIFCQKPFFIPSLILAFTIYIIYESLNNKHISNSKIIFILSSISYTAMTKYTFIPICLMLLIYFCINFIKNNLRNIIKYSIICFLVICFPLLLSKFVYFQDPFSPFLENLLNKNPDIILMGDMYRNWDGFSAGSSFKIINFAIPQSPFTWIDTFGLIVLFPFFYKMPKGSWNLIIIIFVTTTAISYLSNFQARWYVPIFLAMLFFSQTYKLESKKYFSIPLCLYSSALFSFFFIYLAFMIGTHINYGIEDLKSKRIYLYSFMNSQKQIQNGYTITNARNIFFNENLIGYRYPNYSKSLLKQYYKKDIKKGIFFGVKNIKEFENKINIPLHCISDYNFKDIKVAKRNFFGREENEKVLVLKFKEDLIKCL